MISDRKRPLFFQTQALCTTTFTSVQKVSCNRPDFFRRFAQVRVWRRRKFGRRPAPKHSVSASSCFFPLYSAPFSRSGCLSLAGCCDRQFGPQKTWNIWILCAIPLALHALAPASSVATAPWSFSVSVHVASPFPCVTLQPRHACRGSDPAQPGMEVCMCVFCCQPVWFFFSNLESPAQLDGVAISRTANRASVSLAYLHLPAVLLSARLVSEIE